MPREARWVSRGLLGFPRFTGKKWRRSPYDVVWVGVWLCFSQPNRAVIFCGECSFISRRISDVWCTLRERVTTDKEEGTWESYDSTAE